MARVREEGDARAKLGALEGAELVDGTGRGHDLSEFGKRLLLVNVWASWCPGCQAEFESLRRLSARIGPQEIDIVLLSHMDYWAEDVRWLARHPLPFPSLTYTPRSAPLVRSAFLDGNGAFAVPYTLVMGGHRRDILISHLGSRDWAEPSVVGLLAS